MSAHSPRSTRPTVQRLTHLGALAAVVVVAASCACVPFPTGGGTTTTTAAPTTTAGPTTTTAGPTTTTPGPTTTVAPSDDHVDVDALEVGMCIDTADPAEALAEVALSDCEAPHQMEVFAVLDAPDGDYPGGYEIRAHAYEACQEPFEDYVGVPFWDSVYDITTITPSPSTWADGDRSIVCFVVDVDGNPLNSPAQGSTR